MGFEALDSGYNSEEDLPEVSPDELEGYESSYPLHDGICWVADRISGDEEERMYHYLGLETCLRT